GAGGGKDGGVAWVQAKDVKGVILTETMMFCAGVVFRRPLVDPDAGDGQTACNGGIKRGIVVQAEVAAEPDKDVSRFHEHVPTEKGRPFYQNQPHVSGRLKNLLV
ncbi:hypothetical protein QML16_30225, partial [Klebsiella pneumoniae]